VVERTDQQRPGGRQKKGSAKNERLPEKIKQLPERNKVQDPSRVLGKEKKPSVPLLPKGTKGGLVSKKGKEGE